MSQEKQHQQQQQQQQQPARVGRTSSSSTVGSDGSTGIGTGVHQPIRDDLPPNLTPEGLSVDPNVKIYDAIVYLIYCPEHDKIAVTNVERARCVWFPFVCLPDNQTWMQASKAGVDLIIGRKDAEMDAEESAKQAPVYSISFLNILRLQMPSEKFVTRLAMLVVLKKSPNSTFQCCQRSMRINWLRASDIFADRINKVWGPELKNFTKILDDINDKKKGRALITEFSVENSFFHYASEDDSPEKRLLLASHVKPEHTAEIYENFVEHCYPSFYMSFESFKHYLVKYGFDRNDPRLPFLFRASSFYNNDFLHFHEVLLAIIAMEPDTKPYTEARMNFIFKYYDTDDKGYLTLEEFVVMVTDIVKYGPEPNIPESRLKTKIEEAIRCVGMKDRRISKDNFFKAVLSQSFKGTEHLCRSPKAILPQISRLMRTKNEEKTKSQSQTEGLIGSGRSSQKLKSLKKGICLQCRTPNYDYSLHCVTFDTIGRCVKPTIISEQWIEPCKGTEINLHKYSIDYVFNNSSVPNIFLDLIKDFYNKTKFEGRKSKGLMTLPEDWAVFCRYLKNLCGDLKGLLCAEDKLIKINSPALVIGDLQGSLQDLFTIEKIYFHSLPVFANNIVFLGNYSGLGSMGVEVITYLFSLKLLAPNKIFLLRGTNEMASKSRRILRHECTTKYGDFYGKKIYGAIHEIMIRLPFAIIIDESIFCCHSGVSKWNKIEKIIGMPRDVETVIDQPMAYELLVNVPKGMDQCLCSTLMRNRSSQSSQRSGSSQQRSGSSDQSLRKMSHRKLGVHSLIGVTGFTPYEHSDYLNACHFDSTAFNNFIRSNNLNFLIRSHSIVNNENGFDLRFNGKCITVFSCSKVKPFKCTVALVEGRNRKIRLLSFEAEKPALRPVQSTIIDQDEGNAARHRHSS